MDHHWNHRTANLSTREQLTINQRFLQPATIGVENIQQQRTDQNNILLQLLIQLKLSGIHE